MDVDGILDKIPSTEKILGAIWIVSWILAIWMHPLQFFLTGLFCLILSLILSGKIGKQEEKVPKMPAVFSMDKSTRTLKVQNIYESNLKWDDHEICSGAAQLPTGTIKEGDEIKNCKGNVALRHVPSNRLFGGFDFGE
jgi:hypothetical protein